MKKVSFSILILIALSVFHLTSFAQTSCGPYGSPPSCTQCVTIAPVNVFICQGTSLTFTPSVTVPPGYSVLNYSWSPIAPVVPASGGGLPGSTTITPPAPSSLPPACSNILNPYTLSVTALAPNEVTNWDFSLGGIDYCHDFGYVSGTIGMSQETVCPDASAVVPGYTGPSPFLDNDAVHNNMIVAYSDLNPTMVWQQVEFTCPGEQYLLSLYYADLDPTGTATTLRIMVDGVLYGTITSSTLYTWVQFPPVSFSATGTTTTITVLASGDSYFALDDISLQRMCVATGTVNVAVNYPGITGPSTPICPNETVHYTGCTGAVWSSSPTSVATVDAAGNVTGITPGTATISMTDGYGCTATTTVTVSPGPAISGSYSVCVGSTFIWTSSTVPGTWTCTGDITGGGSGMSGTFTAGNVPGTGTIICTNPAFTCTAVATVTVLDGAFISGPTQLCEGSQYIYTGSGTLGGPGLPGDWGFTGGLYLFFYTPPTATATFGGGPSSGPAPITDTNPNTGCAPTLDVTVNPTPADIPAIYLCLGTPFNLNDIPPSITGGDWTTTGSVATITSGPPPTGGAVTTVSLGSENITYTLPTGCFIATSLHIEDCSGGYGIVGSDMCLGNSQTFILPIGIPIGGIWSCSGSAGGSITPAGGYYTPSTIGVEVITYTAPGGATWSITINVYGPADGCVYVTGGIPIGGIVTPYVFHLTSSCPGAIIYYHVEDAGGYVLGSSYGPAGASLNLSDLITLYGPGVFQVCVYEVICNGCITPLNCCASVNPGSTGVSATNNSDQPLMVIPNPNEGTFTLSGMMDNTSGSNKASLEIVDIVGKVVYNDAIEIINGKIKQKITMDSQLPNGIYFIKVKNDDDNKVVRFVLTR